MDDEDDDGSFYLKKNDLVITMWITNSCCEIIHYGLNYVQRIQFEYS